MLGLQLDLIILKDFSNLNDSMKMQWRVKHSLEGCPLQKAAFQWVLLFTLQQTSAIYFQLRTKYSFTSDKLP